MAESSSGKLPFQWDGDDLLISVTVQPRSSNNEISGIHNQQLRIRLTAAPVDGKANQALVKFLSKTFGVAAGRIIIEKGETSKSKRVRVRALEILPEILKNI